MSRFEKAASKAAATPKTAAAPKVAAAPKAGAAPAAKAAAAPGPKLATLEDKKRWVLGHEMKIDDAQQAVDGEKNKAKKKDLENALKKLQTDATYVAAKNDIKEMEAQKIKDAERAALTAKADKKETKKGPAEAVVVKVDEKPTPEVLAEIDDAFAASGKDAATAKATAVARLEGLAACTPFVLPRFDLLVGLFADSKLGGASVKAATKIIECTQPAGHGIAAIAVPALLDGMEAKQWKTKAACIEVLSPCLKQMGEHTPVQLGRVLPLIVPKLAECALEVRAEIRNATGSILREIGAMVASPEIKKLSQELVTALAEPTNQKHTQAVLAKMGNQTFLSLIDPASLSLLMPVVVRGLKERDATSKKWSAQIFGSTAMLVQDVDSIKPFLKTVMPMLQASLTDPVAEVVREAAKAFGVLEHVLPEYSEQHCLPWLFKKLRAGEIGEQLGSSLALAEMDKTKQADLFPEIQVGAMDDKASVRRGFLELMEAMPHAMKMDFVPYIKRLFPYMLNGINGDKEKDEDAGLKSATSLVQRFGDLCPDHLLPGFETAYMASLHSDSPEERNRFQVIRDKCAMLLGKLVDKVLEHKKFGQDLLTTDECSTKEVRENILLMVFIMRFDQDASVKRYANGAWKNAGGAPKLQKQIMPRIEKELARMRAGELGLGAQKFAAKIIDELVKAGDMEAPTGDEPAPAERFVFSLPTDRVEGSKAAKIVAGTLDDGVSGPMSFTRQVSGGQGGTEEVVETHEALAGQATEVRRFANILLGSLILEGRKKKHTGAKIVATAKQAIEHFLEVHGENVDQIKDKLEDLAEKCVRAGLGENFDAHGDTGDGDEEMLLYVENLLLMYGAGHLLLKDTTLEMKKNHRYGVVGQNGAGKTTLMKEIASHRIVGMPEGLKCVHVDDSKLGLMSKSSLNCIEYCIKMAKEIGVDTAGKETLTAVGFPEKMLEEPVADLSTGWRMRMTLAVSMLKHADLVLLDEPTNHLDIESVEALTSAIAKFNGGLVLVSHDARLITEVDCELWVVEDGTCYRFEKGFDGYRDKVLDTLQEREEEVERMEKKRLEDKQKARLKHVDAERMKKKQAELAASQAAEEKAKEKEKEKEKKKAEAAAAEDKKKAAKAKAAAPPDDEEDEDEDEEEEEEEDAVSEEAAGGPATAA
mmetsp:Transcript_51568/g.111983  ORF Transcript_51568/g.111983 Transcript_51568/m.111983 type:complete len:1157 (+) Transcript_51568:87-3557(+)